MKIKLDHLYGSKDSAKVDALETKVTNLSNIAAKVNIANTFNGNQTVNGVVISNQAPTANNHLTNKEYVDNKLKYTRVVNHTNALGANREYVWTIPTNALQTQRINELTVVIPVTNKDLIFSVIAPLNSLTYTNICDLKQFATGNDLTPDITCRFSIHENKIKFKCSSATNGLRVYNRIFEWVE